MHIAPQRRVGISFVEFAWWRPRVRQKDNSFVWFYDLTSPLAPGKLGIVIDNPRNEVPFVHAIKETSILYGRVNVGDLLVSVDEVDCKGLTAIQVSRLISSRNQNPRNLTLMRSAQGMDGSGASAV